MDQWPDLAVSHETLSRLRQFAALVYRRAGETNLVSTRDREALWTRHIVDSAQLVPLLRRRRRILDLGSGAGFPGMVLAIMLDASYEVHLVEMRRKRLDFLREAAFLARAQLFIHGGRAESLVLPNLPEAITARAFAPLPNLLAVSRRFFAPHSRGFFFKGKNWEKELTESRRYWRLTWRAHPSRTRRTSVVLELARPFPLA